MAKLVHSIKWSSLQPGSSCFYLLMLESMRDRVFVREVDKVMRLLLAKECMFGGQSAGQARNQLLVKWGSSGGGEWTR